MSYEDKAEITREFYRRQGENRFKEQLLKELAKLEDHHNGSLWSPKYIMKLIEQTGKENSEDRKNGN